MNFNRSEFRLAAWLAALFLVILGAKLWVVQIYASSLPYWDQWDEAGNFFQPWLEGRLTWSAWFAPHNEHRIFFTRLLDLLVLRLNGQWDPLLQMTINAFIHAGYACGLAYCLWVFTGREKAGLICFLLAPFFALPFAAENTIHGFHSQQYLLCIFSVAAIIGLGFRPMGDRWWCLGLTAAILSIFTMGSGLLASLVVLGLVVLRMLKARRLNQSQLVTLGCGLAVFVIGLALNVSVEGHKCFRAGSFVDFAGALAGNLAWPFEDYPTMLFLVCLPLVITCIAYFRSDFKDPRAAEFLLALGLWGFLQSMALAYGRTNLGNTSRYLDALDTIPMAGLGSWFILHETAEFRRTSQRLFGLFAILWISIAFWGMWHISQTTLEDYLPRNKKTQLIEAENVRAFIATDDPRYLSSQYPQDIPYTSAERLMELLRQPKLLDIMPPACRKPLKLEPDKTSSAAFVLDGCAPENPQREFTRAWGSFSTNGTAATGQFISQPLSARLPKLDVQLCCGPDTKNIHIQLIELATGRKTELKPTLINQWQTVIVSAPQSPFRLEITDQNKNSWVAVGEIKERGRLSFYSLWLTGRAVFILLCGLCLFVFLAGARGVRRNISSNAERLGEFCILLAALAALAGVWRARNFDETQLACQLHRNCAVRFTAQGDAASAKLHLREALWRQPDDVETKKQLHALESHTTGPADLRR